MYKTFQGIDDLQQMVEQAYGVPMTSNCINVMKDTALASVVAMPDSPSKQPWLGPATAMTVP